MSDTPETVKEKAKNLPIIRAMWIHYIVGNHPGDYMECERCLADG